jgi:SAM-dependent methyltransferase
MSLPAADEQRRYFESRERARIALADTPYVRRHVAELSADAALDGAGAILEIGAGLGKFTLPLARAGRPIVANDVSPVLLERLRDASGGSVETLCGDVGELASRTARRFDRVIGFFVLHHLTGFERVFASLFELLEPGGRIAFCEPVSANPLYYLQIAFTPGMTFAGEPSITKMRAGVILPALRGAGFVSARTRPYGFFPPFLANRPAGARIERALERVPAIPRAFQIFSAEKPRT